MENERQIIFIEKLKKKNVLTRQDYEKLTHTSKRTAIRDLQQLLDKRVIIEVSRSKTDPTKKYKLK